MKCPDCQNELKMTTLKGINIRECSKCKGIWLSHGELAKIIQYMEKGVIPEGKGFLDVLNILETKIAVEHPKLAQAWQSIESISPIK